MIRERFLAALDTLKRAFRQDFTNCIVSRRDGEAIYIDGPAKISVKQDKSGTILAIAAPITTSIIREETLGKDSPLPDDQRIERSKAKRNIEGRHSALNWNKAREMLDLMQGTLNLSDEWDADATIYGALCERYNSGERSTDLYNSIKEFCRG